VNKNSIYKIKLAEELVRKHLFRFKNILFIGVSGSVAVGQAKKNDDIDLLIITKKNKLWLTRFLISLYIRWQKIPHRQVGRKEKEDEFCLNMWLDGNNLKLPKYKQSQQSANDLIWLIPLLNKQHIYEKLLVQNSWAKKLVGKKYNQKIKKIKRYKSRQNKVFDWLAGLNWLLFELQYLYMKPKMRGEKVGLGYAFFHRKRELKKAR